MAASAAHDRFAMLERARRARERTRAGRSPGFGDGRKDALPAGAPLGNTYEQVSGASSRSLPVGKRASGPARAPAGRPRVVPRYVQRCGCDALYTWAKADPTRVSRRPSLCGSWRHDGPCARYNASVAFARMREAFAPLPADGNVLLVLTLDRNGVYSQARWKNADEANAALSKQSRNFLKRLRRYGASQGWADFGSKWVATVESHRSSWPHMNFVIHCPELAAELSEDYERRRARGASHRNATVLDGVLLDIAMQTGWGAQSVAERGRSTEALVSYIAKLAGQADATMGELAKLSQTPVAAKQGFRRLRSGVGFLPPKRKNPDYTGTLIRRLPDQRRSAYAAVPLVVLRDPVARHVSTLLLEVEEDRMRREWRYRQPLVLGEQRAPTLPTRERFELRGGRYVLVTGLAPADDGESAPLVDESNADRAPLVLPTDERPAPNAPAPHPEKVHRIEQAQLSLAYTEPIFKLGRGDPYVHLEALHNAFERR